MSDTPSVIKALLEPFMAAALKVGAGIACGMIGLVLMGLGLLNFMFRGSPAMFAIGLILLVIARLLIWPLKGAHK